METPERQKFKLLVVDDETNNLEFVARVFRNSLEVLSATSGEEGLTLVDQHPDVAVVVADQRMPGMNGSEFLSRVYEKVPSSMRVLMTGYSDFESVVDSINRGKIWSYVTKPVAPEQLRRAIEASLEIYTLRFRNTQLTDELAENNQRLQELRDQLEQALDNKDRELQEIVDRYAIPGLFDGRIEQRLFDRPTRIAVDLPVQVEVLGAAPDGLLRGTTRWEWIPLSSELAGRRFEARIAELTESAASVVSEVELPLLSRVTLRFALENAPEAVIPGLVVCRVSQPSEAQRGNGTSFTVGPGFGVLFEAIPVTVRQALTGLIQSKGEV